MRKLIVSEFISLDGVIQAPGGKDEDRDGGFEHGGWTMPYWHDDIGASVRRAHERRGCVPARPAYVRDPRRGVRADAGGRSIRRHDECAEELRRLANAHEADVAQHRIIRDNVVEAVRKLKAQPGGTILTDGSSQLVHTLLENDLVDGLHLLLYPLTLGSGKRLLPSGLNAKFTLERAAPYPTGVVGLQYARQA